MSYEIKIAEFEGPFDLLLFFIERDELDIHEISVSKITDDFLAWLHQMTALNIELASEFILVAATLMRIKARLLLPRKELVESGQEVDPRTLLVERLIEYRRFKQAVPVMVLLEEERLLQNKRGHFFADFEQLTPASFPNEELEKLSLYQLLVTWSRIQKRHQEKGPGIIHAVIQHPYSIEKQKEEILALLRINETLNFSLITSQSMNKLQLVYNFLALLELLQQELLNIELGHGFNNFLLMKRVPIVL